MIEGAAQRISNYYGGPVLPTMSNLSEAAAQGTHEAIGLNDSVRFASPRAEAAARAVPEFLANLVPLGEGASALREAKLPPRLRQEAIEGLHGPEAQGAATADAILEANPAPEVPRGNVPDAAVAEPALPPEAAPGLRGEALPAGDAIPAVEPLDRPPAAGAESVGMAAPESAPQAPAEPLYHASLSPDIESFDLARSGSQSDTGVFGRAAAYATGDERLAPMYLGPKKAEGTLYQVEHSLKNPKEFDSPQAAVEWQGERGTDSPDAAERVRQKYLDAGHDGVIVRNPQTGKVMEAAVFDPNALRITNKRPIAQPKPMEAPRAQDVRIDQGPSDLGGQVREGGQVGGRGDLQQARGAEGNANAEQLRAPREAARTVPEIAQPTSIKLNQMHHERIERGLDELHYEGKRTFGEAWDTARKRIETDPLAGQKVARAVMDEKYTPRAEDIAVLHQDRARINNEHRAAIYDAAEAMKAGDENAAAEARARISDLEDQLEHNDRASRASAHEQGFALSARRLMSKPDYTMAELKLRAKVARGSELTPKQKAMFEDLAKRIEAKDAEIEALRAKTANRVAGRPARLRPKEAEAEFASLADELKAMSRKDLCEIA